MCVYIYIYIYIYNIHTYIYFFNPNFDTFLSNRVVIPFVVVSLLLEFYLFYDLEQSQFNTHFSPGIPEVIRFCQYQCGQCCVSASAFRCRYCNQLPIISTMWDKCVNEKQSVLTHACWRSMAKCFIINSAIPPQAGSPH